MKPKKIKQIFQTENADCGLACLTMTLNTFGCSIDLTQLRRQYDTNLKGMTINQILKILNDYKVNGRVIKLDIQDIARVQTPAILHWEITHYVVLNNVSKNHITINDPELGLCKLSIPEFSEKFTGIAIELTPTKEFKKIVNKDSFSIKNLLSLVGDFKKKIVYLIFLTLITQIFVLLLPYYSQIMIDKVTLNYEFNLLYVTPLLFIVALTLFHVINYLKNIYLIKFSHHIGYKLSSNIFLKLMSLPIGFFEKRNIGDIISRFESVSEIKSIISEDFVKVTINFATILIVIFVLLTYQILLVIPLLVSLSLIVISMLFLQPKYELFLQKAIIKEADANNEIIETIRGIQVVKLFGIENNRTNIWMNKFTHYMNNLFLLNRHRFSQESVKQYFYNIESIVSLFLAVILILQDKLSLGALFAFILYKSLFSDAAISLIEFYFKFKATKIHVNRIADIINHELIKDNYTQKDDHSNYANILEFKSVCFNYTETNMPIINNLSFCLEKNKTLVITGESGSGKTTLFKILAGILHQYDGDIFINGHNLKSKYGKTMIKKIGFVMQNDCLFTGSLANNIALFDTEIDLKRVKEVCKLANISSDIENLPMGYYTMINEIGNILSSGQLQRVLIARALYHKPKILVLDEGTANLDPENERTILENLAQLKITVIHAAHNPVVNEYADKIISLNKKQLDTSTT